MILLLCCCYNDEHKYSIIVTTDILETDISIQAIYTDNSVMFAYYGDIYFLHRLNVKKVSMTKADCWFAMENCAILTLGDNIPTFKLECLRELSIYSIC